MMYDICVSEELQIAQIGSMCGGDGHCDWCIYEEWYFEIFIFVVYIDFKDNLIVLCTVLPFVNILEAGILEPACV